MEQARKVLKQSIKLNSIDVSPPRGMSIQTLKEKIEKLKPSSSPDYWAKKDCGHCSSRGVVTLVTPESNGTREQLCSCAYKGWVRWQKNFVETFDVLKGPSGDSGIKQNEAANPSNGSSKLGHKQERVQAQIERITSRARQFDGAIRDLESRLANLPQRGPVKKAEECLQKCEREHTEFLDTSEMREREAVQLEAEAEAYRKMVKEALQKADQVRRIKNSEILPKVVEAKKACDSAKRELSSAQRDLKCSEHQVHKKIRETEKKRDRLLSRIDRIKKENSLNDLELTSELAGNQPLPASSS